MQENIMNLVKAITEEKNGESDKDLMRSQEI